MGVDTNKDLIKLYHPSGQHPKDMATSLEITVDALYQLGLPAGSFGKVYKNYNYKLPSGIVVIGSDYRWYKYKGSGNVVDPLSDTYDAQGVGVYWVRVGDCYAS